LDSRTYHLSLAELKSLPNLFGGVQLLTLSACNTGVGDTNADGKEVEGLGVLAQRKGAKAVVASLWSVADVSTSLLMQEFYRARESSAATKAEALREAQLALLRGTLKNTEATMASRALLHQPVAKENHSESPHFPLDPKIPFAHPYYWAPFFLMGNWL
jgi:CHAT domain-containing protein